VALLAGLGPVLPEDQGPERRHVAVDLAVLDLHEATVAQLVPGLNIDTGRPEPGRARAARLVA